MDQQDATTTPVNGASTARDLFVLTDEQILEIEPENEAAASPPSETHPQIARQDSSSPSAPRNDESQAASSDAGATEHGPRNTGHEGQVCGGNQRGADAARRDDVARRSRCVPRNGLCRPARPGRSREGKWHLSKRIQSSPIGTSLCRKPARCAVCHRGYPWFAHFKCCRPFNGWSRSRPYGSRSSARCKRGEWCSVFCRCAACRARVWQHGGRTSPHGRLRRL